MSVCLHPSQRNVADRVRNEIDPRVKEPNGDCQGFVCLHPQARLGTNSSEVQARAPRLRYKKGPLSKTELLSEALRSGGRGRQCRR